MQGKELLKLIQFGGIFFFFFAWPFIRGLVKAKQGQEAVRRKNASRGKGARRTSVRRAKRQPPIVTPPVVVGSSPSHSSTGSPTRNQPTTGQTMSSQATVASVPDPQHQAREWEAQLERYKSVGPSAEYENLEGGLYSELDQGFHHHVSVPESLVKEAPKSFRLDRDAVIAAVVLGEASILQRPGVRRRSVPKVRASPAQRTRITSDDGGRLGAI